MAALFPQLAKSDIEDKWTKQATRRLSEIRKDLMVGASEDHEIRREVQGIREAMKIKLSKQTSHLILEWNNGLDKCPHM